VEIGVEGDFFNLGGATRNHDRVLGALAVVTRPPDRASPVSPELVDACRRGDRAALEVVLAAHARDLERLLVRLIGPGADVEDLLQLTLIGAVESFPRFRGEASVRTWLSRIAVNIVREHLRRPERTRKVALELVSDEPAGQGAAPDAVTESRRRLERIYHHIAALPVKQRIAFVLHVFEGRPVDEVAALMRASRAATKSRVFWARRELIRRARRDPALRDALTDRGGDT
jgi:RNA polymerase sigma-70 factor (ECF subfamily)